jgi:hypothetical protein
MAHKEIVAAKSHTSELPAMPVCQVLQRQEKKYFDGLYTSFICATLIWVQGGWRFGNFLRSGQQGAGSPIPVILAISPGAPSC